MEKKYYRIKHKVTGLYLNGVDYDGRKRGWIPAFNKSANRADRDWIRYVIERMIQYKHSAILDECEMEAYEIIEQPCACKPMIYYRNMVEQKVIVQKLKQR